MASTALIPAAREVQTGAAAVGFDFANLRYFACIPDHRDIGVAAMAGLAVIYDQALLFREGIVDGALYVRESQRPPSRMQWDRWLQHEWDDEDRVGRAQPASPLSTRREVVQALYRPETAQWSLRLANGHIDGPYEDWAFGRDLVGKVLGIYRPN